MASGFDGTIRRRRWFLSLRRRRWRPRNEVVEETEVPVSTTSKHTVINRPIEDSFRSNFVDSRVSSRRSRSVIFRKILFERLNDQIVPPWKLAAGPTCSKKRTIFPRNQGQRFIALACQ
jgi:hypothetical protein